MVKQLRKIAVLDQHTIDKIAAGEVVERPSSVVKELVENAIDAGATAVTVEIKEGGRSLIRITDNGGGIDKEEVPLAFLRHATSKIERVEDLEHIASLGFRGEALSSIAAVAQVELITKTHNAMSGVRYVIEGGVEKTLEEIGAPDGTTFLVRNLFYNIPARNKFLKTATTEAGYVSTLMEQLALSHPEISFKYIQNGQVKLHTSGNYNPKDVIYSIYGRDIARELLEVQYENDFMTLTGYVGKPEISRGNRYFENYYINGRYVKDKIITKAIEDAYKGFLMQHKFPFVSLQIQMEGNDLDVNVHPSKMEVRFSRGTEVYDAIYRAIWKVLNHKELIPQVTLDSPKEEALRKQHTEYLKKGAVPEPFEKNRIQETSSYGHTFTKEEEGFFRGTLKEAEAKARQKAESHGASFPEDTENLLPHQPQRSQTVPASQGLQQQIVKPSEGSPQSQTVQPSESLQQTQTVKPSESSQQPQTVQPTQDSQQLQALKSSQNPPQSQIVQSSQGLPQPQASQAGKASKPEQLELFDDKLLSKKARSRHQLIGQLFDTYWLVQYEDKFYIIDQHAAHEKVYYERFVKRFEAREITSQYVSPPLIVTLSLQEEELLHANQDFFRDFGFEIENFGGREYAISAVPTELLGHTQEELFLEMLDHLAGKGEKNALDIFTGRLATMACKAAVKGNHALSSQEADKLIDELLALKNPYHCPHGRPTIISMTKTELEKKFKRII